MKSKSSILDDSVFFETPWGKTEDDVVQVLPLHLPKCASGEVKSQIIKACISYMHQEEGIKAVLVNNGTKEHIQRTLKTGNVLIGYGGTLFSFIGGVCLVSTMVHEVTHFKSYGSLVLDLMLFLYCLGSFLFAIGNIPKTTIIQKEIIEI